MQVPRPTYGTRVAEIQDRNVAKQTREMGRKRNEKGPDRRFEIEAALASFTHPIGGVSRDETFRNAPRV